MPDFSKILYFGSPFLPIVSKSNFDNIRQMQLTGQNSHLLSLASELCNIGIVHNQMHFEELDWISKSFQIGPTEITEFFIGFTMVPVLLIGSEFLRKYDDVKTTIKKICPPTSDTYQIRVNQYKANMVFLLHLKLTDIPTNLISKKIVVAHEICNEKPFSHHTYFLAGQDSAMSTALSLLTPPS